MVRVIFVHPDLGIGGAERLAVDAALATQENGHYVHFVTSHHDPNHCFLETKNGTLSVTVVGDWLPRSIFGKFYALFAYIRMIYAAMYITFFSGLQPDIVFCDLISICIPIFKFGGIQTLFYCHFPDQLLSQPGSSLKSVYRAPLNWLEEITTGKAHKIFVNSKFTAKTFKNTFKRLSVNPEILYPSINTSFYDQSTPMPLNKVLHKDLPKDGVVFLSINRYERKKNLGLALNSLNELKKLINEENWSQINIVMVGGYDERVNENVEYYEELVVLATQLGIDDKVTFLRSPSDVEKISLLYGCDCLIYTPSNEHFGIVPLEGMYASKPVIAVNSGGPTETVVDGVTGFLCHDSPQDFAAAMLKCITDKNLCLNMGKAGKLRVHNTFSFTAFSNQLENVIQTLFNVKNKKD